jgi:hypothetical protein
LGAGYRWPVTSNAVSKRTVKATNRARRKKANHGVKPNRGNKK